VLPRWDRGLSQRHADGGCTQGHLTGLWNPGDIKQKGENQKRRGDRVRWSFELSPYYHAGYHAAFSLCTLPSVPTHSVYYFVYSHTVRYGPLTVPFYLVHSSVRPLTNTPVVFSRLRLPATVECNPGPERHHSKFRPYACTYAAIWLMQSVRTTGFLKYITETRSLQLVRSAALDP
jgi:hypothetical protein